MKKILLVDDDKDIREVLKKKLTLNKYAVMTASSGQEALIICKTSVPDLVILDIAMPYMDGYETCKMLKEDNKTSNIPVFFLTGKELEPTGITGRCRDLGAFGYIYKPCSSQDLLMEIKKIIG